jgi:FkbM family methyltransferase
MNKIYGIFLDHVMHNLKFLVGKRTFFFFCFINKILIFGKGFGFKTFSIRNFYDYITIREIFILECYKINQLLNYNKIKNFYNNIESKNKIPILIDCGANIGASSYYFEKKYKKSKLICLEPDKGNFEVLIKNIISSDIIKINKAVSSEIEKLKMLRTTEDPRAFSAVTSKDGDVQSTSINEILSNFSDDKYEPFLIKIDIEGGEKNLFEKNLEWIDKFKIIIIEPHDWMYPENNIFQNFLKSISYLNRDFVILNENIISIRNE